MGKESVDYAYLIAVQRAKTEVGFQATVYGIVVVDSRSSAEDLVGC